MNRVEALSVSVPATTANLGPGFDCLGMALDLRNTLEFKYGEPGLIVEGEGRRVIMAEATNLVQKSFRRVFDELGRSTPDVSVRCFNRVHCSRALEAARRQW